MGMNPAKGYGLCMFMLSRLLYPCSFSAAKPPKVMFQPVSQKDVLLGKTVAFLVKATGTQPLQYQWQWKQFGRESEKDGWQNLTSEGSTFQVVEVKASTAGYYRCVVSNSAGSQTSQCASLTVGKDIHCRRVK